jgi:glycosyltransferase involved in cell wall biosynthesis
VTGKTTSELIQCMPGHPQVIYTGYLPDIRSVLMKCAVCVVPLLTGGGTRLKILESLSSGISVVSTSVGAEGLDLVDGTDLLIADHPQHFAKCVVDILNEATLREKLRINGRCLVEKRYDWPMICDQFEKYMQEILLTRRSMERR